MTAPVHGMSATDLLHQLQAVGAELLRCGGGSPPLQEAWARTVHQVANHLGQALPSEGLTSEPRATGSLEWYAPEPPPDRSALAAQLVPDRSGIIREANEAALVLLRARKEFVLGKPLACFIAYADWLLFYNWLARLQAGTVESLTDWSLQVLPLHSASRRMTVLVTRLHGPAGQAHELRWQLRALSGQEEVERVLRHERYFSDSVLEIAQTLILVVTRRATIVRANHALCQALGCSATELEGRPCSEFMPPSERAEFERLLAGAWQSGATRRLLGTLLPAHGAPRAVVWGIKSLATGPTAPATLLAVGHDVTELQETQRQALQSERLAAIGQVATALAHEARNMLQRIQGGLDRLAWRLEDRPEALAILASVRHAQGDLTHLFDDVRSCAAPLLLERSWCSLAEVWREAWQQALVGEPGKAARLHEQGVGAVDALYWGDRFRLGQVFRNIFENALAAGPAPVEVSLACSATELNQAPAVALAVLDNGPGLNAEQQQNIFEPFFTTKPRGTGLGMAIAKRVIEAHGGRIEVGAVGAGAEIVVTLPRRLTG